MLFLAVVFKYVIVAPDPCIERHSASRAFVSHVPVCVEAINIVVVEFVRHAQDIFLIPNVLVHVCLAIRAKRRMTDV